MGAPSANSLPEPDKNPQDLHNQLAEIEKASGQTVRSLQLHGRAYLLQGNFQKAVARYRLALVLDPGNPALQLELGISFALRARAENRPLDDEFALEYILQSARASHAPEASFDSALLFEEAQLLLQASERWKILRAELKRSNPWYRAWLKRSDPWYDDVETRWKKLNERLEARKHRINDLTLSSASYLAHAQEARDSIELVVGKALADWLPDAGKPDVQKALDRLAGELENQHHDPWLKELLKVLPSPQGKSALRSLSDAWNANMSGDHDQAEKSAMEAEKLFKGLGNTSGKLRSRLELVYSFQRRGQSEKCLEALGLVQKPKLTNRYPWMAGQAELEKISCTTLDWQADGVARREAALQRIAPMHYEALRLRALGFTTERCVCFGSRLRVWSRAQEGAIAFWNHPLPNLRGFEFYNNMAYSAHSAGNLAAAIALLRESTRILETAGNQELYALILGDLAKWELEAGFYDDFLRDFDNSAALFKKLNRPDSAFRSEAELRHAEAEIAIGKPDLAQRRLQQLPYRELQKAERINLLMVQGDVSFALQKDSEALAAYKEVIQQTREPIEQNKKEDSKATGQSKKKVKKKPEPLPCDRAENAQLGIEPAWRGLVAVELRQKQTEQAVVDWETFRGGSRSDSSRDPIHPGKGSSLLVYAFLPDRQLSGWMINHDGVRAQQMLDRNAALRLAAEFSALAANRETPPESIRKSARALNDVLIAPFAKDLPPDNSLLVIDADGPLSSIPWAALEDSNGHALIERYSLAQTTARAKANVADQDMHIAKALIVSEPALGKSLQEQYPSLPEVQRETDEVRKRLPGAVFLQGASATLEGIEKNVSGSTLFHFSGHGISYGGFGALVLAPSANDSIPARFITANEISRLPLHDLRMAVLAACSSGAGEQYGVVNLDSLVRGFLDAGAPRVVAARWDVNDEITTYLMINFYAGILQGEQPAEALRQASLRARKARPHPYYWASFQVFGAP